MTPTAKLLAGALASCMVAPIQGAPAADFNACLTGLQQQAVAAGVDESVAEDALLDLKPQPRVLEFDRRQPEFAQTFAAYLNARASRQHVDKGRRLLAQHRAFLDGLTREYGVPGRYLIALWGLETNYGSYLGDMPTLASLATLACDGRRSTFFAGELVDALRLVQRESLRPDDLRGSWAGAMGHTQFMPSSYVRFAVDGDGDGRIDLWKSSQDALASGARLLQSLDWRRGERWGREILLPDGFSFQYAGVDKRRSVADWAALGVRTATGAALPNADIEGSVVVPAGHRGPAFLVYANFAAIMGWNQSEFYALTAGHLADRIAGAGTLRKPPPTDQKPLSRAQTTDLQRRLLAAGYAVGEVDGLWGPATRAALSAWQRDADLLDDGFPDRQSLQRLQVHDGD